MFHHPRPFTVDSLNFAGIKFRAFGTRTFFAGFNFAPSRPLPILNVLEIVEKLSFAVFNFAFFQNARKTRN